MTGMERFGVRLGKLEERGRAGVTIYALVVEPLAAALGDLAGAADYVLKTSILQRFNSQRVEAIVAGPQKGQIARRLRRMQGDQLARRTRMGLGQEGHSFTFTFGRGRRIPIKQFRALDWEKVTRSLLAELGSVKGFRPPAPAHSGQGEQGGLF